MSEAALVHRALLQAVLNLDVMAAGLNPQISTLPR